VLVYACMPPSVADQRIAPTGEHYPVCSGGGAWIESTEIAGSSPLTQPIDAESFSDLLSAVALAFAIAVGIHLVRKVMR